MLVSYTTANGRLRFELEVTTGKQAFEIIAAIQELFEEKACGCCEGENLTCEVREIGGNKYYSIRCGDCRAQLDFGQNRDGKGLFVRRWDKDNKQPLENRGWYVYHSGQYGKSTQPHPKDAPVRQKIAPRSSDEPIPY